MQFGENVKSHKTEVDVYLNSFPRMSASIPEKADVRECVCVCILCFKVSSCKGEPWRLSDSHDSSPLLKLYSTERTTPLSSPRCTYMCTSSAKSHNKYLVVVRELGKEKTLVCVFQLRPDSREGRMLMSGMWLAVCAASRLVTIKPHTVPLRLRAQTEQGEESDAQLDTLDTPWTFTTGSHQRNPNYSKSSKRESAGILIEKLWPWARTVQHQVSLNV